MIFDFFLFLKLVKIMFKFKSSLKMNTLMCVSSLAAMDNVDDHFIAVYYNLASFFYDGNELLAQMFISLSVFF